MPNSEETANEATIEKEKSGAETQPRQEEEISRLIEENRALSAELDSMREKNRKREEREKGRETLRRLTGDSHGELFELAAERAEQSEELSVLPPEKRYEMSYYLILGERSAKNGGGTAGKKLSSPVFFHSDGSGVSPATEMPAPTTLEMARENAKKYFGL